MGLIALILPFLGLGWICAHKFAMGYTKQGVLSIVLSLCTLFLFGTVVSLVEGIIYLTMTDDQWYQTYIVGKKNWL